MPRKPRIGLGAEESLFEQLNDCLKVRLACCIALNIKSGLGILNSLGLCGDNIIICCY